MTRGQTTEFVDRIINSGPSPAQDSHRSIIAFPDQIFWSLLAPFKTSIGTIDAQFKLIFLSTCNLAEFNDSLGSIVKTQKDACIVIQHTPFYKGGKIC